MVETRPGKAIALMIRSGILNPAINSLISRVRHTNTLVLADRGFPFWPAIETIDISLTDDIPRVLDVLAALRSNFVIGRITMAEEFQSANPPKTYASFIKAMHGIPLTFEAHTELKKRVPMAIGLIRTGDTTQYANMIIESA